MSKNIISMKTDRSYLVWYAQRGPAVFGDWIWLNEKFFPTLERFKKVALTQKDNDLISDIYYKIGDIFFFLDAPQESLKYFQLSVKYDSKHAGAYREIGGIYGSFGEHLESEKYLKKALSLWENDTCTQADLKHVLRDIKENTPPIYNTGDKIWLVDELLAQGKFEEVLSQLNNVDTIKERQQKASAYGGLHQINNFIEEWESISEMKGYMELYTSDGFYMPQKLWNNVRFWKAYIKLKGKWLLSGTSWYPEILSSIVSTSNDDLINHQERMFLYGKYQIARISKDKILSKELVDKYPKWIGICKLNQRLN